MVRLRVALDVRVVQDRYHGIGRYAFEQARALARAGEVELVLICGQDRDDRLSPRSAVLGADTIRLDFGSSPTGLEQHAQWPSILRRAGADVLVVFHHLSTPWRHQTPVVSFVHDCILESRAPGGLRQPARTLYRQATRVALQRSDVLATVSEATRLDVHRRYGVEIPTQNVVRPGVDDRFLTPRSGAELKSARKTLRLPQRYLLAVGAQRPQKNHAVLVRALRLLGDLQPPVHLVIVGAQDNRFRSGVPLGGRDRRNQGEVHQLARELEVHDRVHVMSDVAEDLLPAVYQGASALAFPSVVEGFGMPVLEAMASNVPVVATDVPAVAEVARDAVLVVSPHDPDAWERALRRVLTDPELAMQLRRSGAAVARANTWEESAKGLRAVLEHAAEGAGPAAVSRTPGWRRANDGL